MSLGQTKCYFLVANRLRWVGLENRSSEILSNRHSWELGLGGVRGGGGGPGRPWEEPHQEGFFYNKITCICQLDMAIPRY